MFKEVLVNNKININDLKRKKDMSQNDTGLNDIAEVNSSNSEIERPLSLGASVGTIYTETEQSESTNSPMKKGSPFYNEEILKKTGLPTKEPKPEMENVEVQASAETTDQCIGTELEIKANELEWSDINMDEELGKEAAKTIIALDYYLKACDEEHQHSSFQNVDLKDFNKSETQTIDSKVMMNKCFSPEISPKYQTLNNSMNKNLNRKMLATGGGFKLKEKPTRNINTTFSSGFSKTRHRYSQSNVPMNRFREYAVGTKSIFGSYVKAELKRQKIKETPSANLPHISQTAEPRKRYK